MTGTEGEEVTEKTQMLSDLNEAENDARESVEKGQNKRRWLEQVLLDAAHKSV